MRVETDLTDSFVQFLSETRFFPINIDNILRVNQILVQKCLQESSFPILRLSSPLTIFHPCKHNFQFSLWARFERWKVSFLQIVVS